MYILERLVNGEYYIGSSSDVDRRLQQHNAGNVSATKNKRPYRLAFNQEYPSLEVAKKVEFKNQKMEAERFY